VIRSILTTAACLVTLSAWLHLAGPPVEVSAQTGRAGAATGRTLWGDPDLQGEWTAEGEYGVPFERPAQFGTRQVLTDEEYAKRLQDVRARDMRAISRRWTSSQERWRGRMRRFRTGASTTRPPVAPPS